MDTAVTETINGNSLIMRQTSGTGDGAGTGNLFINQDGSGAFTIANNISFTNSVVFAGVGSGTVTFSGALSGAAPSGITVNNTGGATFVFSGNNSVSGTGATNFTLTAGTVDVQNVNALGGNSKNATINGGTLQSSNGTTLATRTGGFTLGGDFTLAGSGNWSMGASAVTLTGNRTITANTGGTTGATIAGVIGDGGSGFGLTLGSGSIGTLTLTKANTYTGNTVINGGKLILSLAGSINSSPLINVASGATFDVSTVTSGYSLATGQTLRGAGAVTGAVTLSTGSTLAGGVDTSTLGTLTFNSSITANSGSAFSLKLNSDGTPASDKLVAASFSLGLGNATLALTDLGSTVLTVGTTFTLLHGTSTITGTFSGLLDGTTLQVGSNFYTINYGSQDVTLTAAGSAIPEPSTYAALAGLGALGLAALRRRRRA